jgi:hypothetical protein
VDIFLSLAAAHSINHTQTLLSPEKNQTHKTFILPLIEILEVIVFSGFALPGAFTLYVAFKVSRTSIKTI